VPVFNAHVAGGLCSSARWERSAHVYAGAPIVNVSVIATMSAALISGSLRVSTVESSLDGQPMRWRRTPRALRCTGGTYEFIPHEQESNSLAW